MNNEARVVVQAAVGRSGIRDLPARRVEAYAFDTAMDTDTDAFSIDIGDSHNEMSVLLGRDVEARVALFLNDERGKMQRVFSGIGDLEGKSASDMVLSIQGSDMSTLALGDVPPGRWRNIKPKQFITERARRVGITNVSINPMSQVGTLYTDGSETEWGLWYRIARTKGMWMWTEPNGTLVIDKLGYALKPSYMFGRPPRGQSTSGWLMPEDVEITKDSSGRLGEAWVYGEDAKSKQPFAGRGIDTSIKSWKRKPLRITTSADIKSQRDAKQQADEEVFDSIVGAREITVTLHHSGQIIKQNKMARLNIPELELAGTYFVVGNRVEGGPGGRTQTIRLRERGFALSKKVPDAPVLDQGDEADTKVPSSVGDQLAAIGSGVGLKWADSFVRATREFGVPAGWDFSVFLGVLLSICQHESSVANRRGIVTGAINEETWVPWNVFYSSHETMGQVAARSLYERSYANERRNPYNPRGSSSNTAVGPMQLVSDSYVDWADKFGWNGREKSGEYEGGRWNPDSNIRAAARALVEKLNYAPKANPSDPNAIWIGVSRYYGSTDASANAAYTKAVRKNYEDTFKALSEGSVTSATTLPRGTQTKIPIPGYGSLEIRTDTPDGIKKAINFCLKRLGDPYRWGGSGPYYDCSSLVTAAYASNVPALKSELDEPREGYHGETTYTLWRKGRFPAPLRDKLLPGDLVFFHHGGTTPEHVGMYLSDNMMIHDPKTGDVIKISNISDGYYAEHYMGARRLVNWGYLATSDT
jgi:cell wall-associated NlpC family hydrolase/prophage tail gpP-like protein